MTVWNGVSFLGLFVLLAIAWVLSTNRKVVNWRLLGWGVGLQMLLGFLVFRLSIGRKAFLMVNNAFVAVINAANKGAEFVFGPLALGPGVEKPGVGKSIGFILATQALPLIVVFSAIVAILYHFGIMQRIIKAFAWLFSNLFRVSGAEGLCAAGNIFVGVESSLAVRPYLRKMTQSELCAVLTVGMATVASNVIGFYYFILKDQFPTIAGHLVSASLLSAPAALMMAKMVCPETEEPLTLGKHVEPFHEKEDNVFAAVISGANNGMKLMIGIAALLLALVGIVGILNMILTTVGGDALALENILGHLFQPFAVIMGVPWEDSAAVGKLVGVRLVLTEVAGYQQLAGQIQAGAISPRSAAITAYALCGFAHIPSLAIFVGGTAALAPERKADLTRVAVRALIAANLACLMTGCIAGIFAGSDLILIAR